MDVQNQTIQKLTKNLEQGDAMISRILREIVENNRLAKNQLPMVFYSATANASNLKDKTDPIRRELEDIEKQEAKGKLDEDTAIIKQILLEEYKPLEKDRKSMHMLASIAANKLAVFHGSFIEDTTDDILSALRDPGNASAEEMRMLSRNLMVLIGQDMVKRDNQFIELAEAVLEGLEKTKDTKKRSEMLYLAQVIIGRLPSELSRIYENTFNIALKNPNQESIERSKVILSAKLNSYRRGESQLSDVVVRRLERSVLSDGDMHLPKPKMAKVKKKLAVSMPRKLAFAKN
jgi:hypothetical protein